MALVSEGEGVQRSGDFGLTNELRPKSLQE